MSDIEAKISPARISQRNRTYKITEMGRAAIAKFLEPDVAFNLFGLGPNDRATLTVLVNVEGDPTLNGIYQVHLDIPANMLEECS